MRRLPAPLSVTRPPPSSTTVAWALRTFAVAFMVIVTGLGPQSNVMIPPAATAFTTAAEVQLDGVPLPIVRVGWLVSTAAAAAGTAACPAGLPGFGSVFGFRVADAEGLATGAGLLEATAPGVAEATTAGVTQAAAGSAFSAAEPQPTRAPGAASRPVRIATRRFRTGRW